MTAKPLSLSSKNAQNLKPKPLKKRTSVTGDLEKKSVRLDVTSTTVNRLMAKIKEL
mgnify:CR=1 FL=1